MKDNPEKSAKKGENLEAIAFPCHLFFYGTLQDEGVLGGLLGLDLKPAFRPATITGWKLKKWLFYPTLVPGSDEVVKGLVWECTSLDHLLSLQSYETQAYHLRPVAITLENGEVLENGHAFTWSGAADESDLTEGSFDLAEFQQNHKQPWHLCP